MMSSKNGIILLSGGLDCVCALACLKDEIGLALTFNYGQESFENEKNAAQNISKFYGIEHKTIELPWLKDLAKMQILSLTEDDLTDETLMKQTAQKVWIPNRNAVFINVAAAIADSKDREYNKIVIGVNKEEAATFSDNSAKFIDAINESLKYSTQVDVRVVAPLINLEKKDIIKLAVEKGAPMEYIYSCYHAGTMQCGECESCLRLKRALKSLDGDLAKKLYKTYFGELNEL